MIMMNVILKQTLFIWGENNNILEQLQVDIDNEDEAHNEGLNLRFDEPVGLRIAMPGPQNQQISKLIELDWHQPW